MTSAARRGPNADRIARMLAALRIVSDESFAALARFYDPAEEAARNDAWALVQDAAARAGLAGAIDEIREAAFDLVGLRASTVYGWEAETPFVRGRPSPTDQVRIANSIIEAAGAILVRDRLSDDTLDLLCGPVLDVLGWPTV